MTVNRSFGRRLRSFAAFNVGQQVWLAGLSLVATPVLYHRLGGSAYGLLAVVGLVAAQLSFLEFGFSHATIRYLARYQAVGDVDGMRRTLSTSSWVYLGGALIGVTVLFATAEVLAERYFQMPPELVATGKAALLLCAPFLLVSMFGSLGNAVFQGLQKFAYINVISGAAATLQVLGSVVLVLAGHGVLPVVMWTITLGILTLVVHVWWLHRTSPGVRPFGRPELSSFREMAGFGLFLMVAGLFTQVFVSGTPLLLGRYVSLGALPFFTIPFGLYQRLNRVNHGVASALYPLVSEMESLGDTSSLRRTFVSGTRILAVGAAILVPPGVLVSTPFLAMWMGAEFAREAGGVLETLVVVVGFAIVALPSVELGRGAGRGRLLVAYTGIQASVSLAGVAVLAPRSGAAGAATALLLGQAAASGFVLLRVGGGHVRQVLSVSMIALLGAAGLGTLAGIAWAPSPVARLALAVGLAAGLALLGVFWVLSGEERLTLRRMVGLQ